jgi:hypothetical protein
MNPLNIAILNRAFANGLDAAIEKTDTGTYALFISDDAEGTRELFSSFEDRILPDDEMIIIELY